MIRMTLHTEREQGRVLDEGFNAEIRCTETIETNTVMSIPIVQDILQTICHKINTAKDSDALNEYLQSVYRAVAFPPQYRGAR